MNDAISSHLPLPGASLHVLAALAGGTKHGYAIMRQVEELTGGTVVMGPGTLYGTIKRLLEEGLIEEVEGDPEHDGIARRFYRLTGLGERVLAAETERLARIVQGVRAQVGFRAIPGVG